MSEKFTYENFKNINLDDDFFQSLKNDYKGFSDWFKKKSDHNEKAYIQTIDDNIEGFLYLKVENGPITDLVPALDVASAVKIGTLKINPHGTRLGERFIKKSIDYAINLGIDTIYVTIFDTHPELFTLLKKYGFYEYGKKETLNGIEFVLIKVLSKITNDILLDYPKVNFFDCKKYLLSIYPDYHTQLFPDSILDNETFDIVKDISHTNSIQKIYICKMRQITRLNKGDILLIYRTTDKKGPAKYRSVATTLCCVEEVKSKSNFRTFDDFKKYCKNHSIFDDKELKEMFDDNDNCYIIKITYNVAFKKRIIRKDLIDKIGLSPVNYWGFFELTDLQLKNIIELSDVNESYIVY